MVTHIYTIPGCKYWDDRPDTLKYTVYIFILPPYNEVNKLHQHQRRRRCWAKCDCFCNRINSHKRTRQIERWLKLSRFEHAVQIGL